MKRPNYDVEVRRVHVGGLIDICYVFMGLSVRGIGRERLTVPFLYAVRSEVLISTKVPYSCFLMNEGVTIPSGLLRKIRFGSGDILDGVSIIQGARDNGVGYVSPAFTIVRLT